MGPAKGDVGTIRNHNRSLVVNLLRASGPMSRTQLSQRTGLAPSALTRMVGSLLQEGLVLEAGKSASRGGRRAVMLAFNPAYASTVGVKIERDQLLAGRIDLAGRILQTESHALDRDLQPRDVLNCVARVVESLREGRILGVGVGISGFVDAERGVDLYSPILGWRGVPVAAPLSEQLQLPVWVENDVNALTIAEWRYGAARNLQDFVCITVGEGIGAGLVVNGRLYHGRFGGAGEMGHFCLDPAGPVCRCGGNGCVEAYVSDRAIRAGAQALGFNTLEELSRSARNGTPEAREVYVRMGRLLGVGAKNVVNLLNPEALVLGGERMVDADLFLPSFLEELRRHAFSHETQELRVVPAELGDDGFLIGAGTLATERLFEQPSVDGDDAARGRCGSATAAEMPRRVTLKGVGA